MTVSRDCVECGKPFVPNRPNRILCGALCERERNRLKLAAVYRQSPHQHKELGIFERDGWACYLCQLPIDPALAWPHPQSKSIDHVIPICRGGEDTAANKRATHLGCNWSKNYRLPSEYQEAVAAIVAARRAR